jgi:hypothetical protein
MGEGRATSEVLQGDGFGKGGWEMREGIDSNGSSNAAQRCETHLCVPKIRNSSTSMDSEPAYSHCLPPFVTVMQASYFKHPHIGPSSGDCTGRRTGASLSNTLCVR